MNANLDTLYAEKDPAYFANARRDYVMALPDNPGAAMLEIGCGNGATGALALQLEKCSTWVGVEVFEPVAAQARSSLTAVHVGDVETMDLRYPDSSFDALICSEVLEHLTDPGAVLSKLKRLIKPGGRVYASVPNASHWRIVSQLMFGRFDYADVGPMDRTHLRWFTPATFRRLFEDAGFKIDCVRPAGPDFALRQTIAHLPFFHLLWTQIDARGHV